MSYCSGPGCTHPDHSKEAMAEIDKLVAPPPDTGTKPGWMRFATMNVPNRKDRRRAQKLERLSRTKGQTA